MDSTEIKKLIRQQLPAVLQEDESFRHIIQQMLQDSFADKQKTEDRFDVMLAEIRAMREESERKWAEWKEKSEQDRAEWKAEMKALREESERKWAEWKEKSEQDRAEWKAEMQALREESERKWAEWKEKSEQNRAEWRAEMKAMREDFDELRQEVQKYNSNIGALGARWGTQSEQSFRNALKSILEQSFAVKVQNVTEYDAAGEVFGHPDQIELDIIIKNGLLIICEIKSSISKSELYSFVRKVQFYEKLHHRQADRRIVISPMVDRYVYPVAEKLEIEVYSYAQDVSPEEG